MRLAALFGSRGWKESGRHEVPRPDSHWQDASATQFVTYGQCHPAAAIMKNLDLVITSDTSIPHLAGALGVPVWLALPFAADWRWLLDRHDSPWYPNMRLFRQKNPGDWSTIFSDIHLALCERLSA